MKLRTSQRISILLILCLALALLPGTAWAADGDFNIMDGVLISYNGPGGDVVIPSGVTAIGKWAFTSLDSLTGVTIPAGVTAIGDQAFEECKNLARVTIPDGVATIGTQAFSGCESLTSVSIPDSVTTIGPRAFWYSGLTSVTIPGSVSAIQERMFYGCGDLASVVIGDGVTSVGHLAFRDCTSLTSVTFPDSVTTIEPRVFYGCTALTEVTFPKKMTSLGEQQFDYCSALTSVTFPGGVTTIGAAMCRDCSSLTSAIIPDGVTGIEVNAFAWCGSLTEVTIPASVTVIGVSAFQGCNSLTDVYYGGSAGQWDRILVDEMNVPLLNAAIHFSDGTSTADAPQAGGEPAAPAAVGVTVNGAAVTWTDAAPFIDSNDRTMVPLRAVADAMGLEVNWDAAAREASFTNGAKTIWFPIDSATARVSDGEPVRMDTAAVIANERTYAPVRYLAEYFGYTVDWDAAARIATIK